MKGWHLPKNGFDPEKKEIGPHNLPDTQNAPFLMYTGRKVIEAKKRKLIKELNITLELGRKGRRHIMGGQKECTQTCYNLKQRWRRTA
jgi:hypothetical protein